MMKTSDEIIDGFDGLLTKEQANRLYSESKLCNIKSEGTVTAELMGGLMGHGATGILKGLEKEKLSIKDEIYRIFNPVKKNFGNSDSVSRILVLGKEGRTVNVLLGKKISDAIDSEGICRGDAIIVTGLTIDMRASLLRSTQKTAIKRLAAADNRISDFSLLNSGMKDINITGIAIEAWPIRIAENGFPKQSAVTYVVLSDGKRPVRVACTGSSANMASKLPLNSKVLIEFCTVRENSGKIEVHAGNFSRVAALFK